MAGSSQRRSVTATAVGVAVAVLAIACLPALAATARPAAAQPAEAGPQIEGATSEVKLSSSTPVVAYTLRILLGNTEEVKDLRVLVEPFIDASGAQTNPTATVNGTPANGDNRIDVPALGIVPLMLTATLPAGGDYTSRVILTLDGTQKVFTLTVTRTNVAPTVTVDPISSVAPEIGLTAINVDVTVSLRETGGRMVVLDQNPLTSLVLKSGTDTVQAPHGTIEMLDANGRSLGTTIRLQPGEAKVVTLHLHNIGGAGQYTGNLRLASKGSPPVDTSFILLVRRAWWIAAAFIAVGVLISWLITTYLGTWRKRLLAQSQVSRLSASLESIVAGRTLTAVQASVVDGLRAKLAELYYGSVAPDAIDDITAATKMMQGKLQLLSQWLDLQAAVAAAGDPVLQAQLSPATNYLTSDSPTSDQQTKAQQALDAVVSTINTTRVSASAATVSAALNSWMAAADPAVQAQAQAAKLSDMVNAAQTALANNKLDDAVRSLATLKETWTPMLVRNLQARISGPPPLGVGSDDWATAQAAVRDAIQGAQGGSVENVLAQYEKGESAILATAIPGLQSNAQGRAAAATAAGRNDAASAFAAAGQILTDAKVALDRGDVQAAQRLYTQGVEASRQAATLLPAGVGQMGDAAAPPVAAAPTLGAIRGIPAGTLKVAGIASAKKNGVIPGVSRITAAIGRYDAIVDLALGAIAVLTGLQLLWVTNTVWGTLSDLIIAVLWGLGLHQVGSTSFTGIAGLRASFAAGTQAAALGQAPGGNVPPGNR
jgi:hypothetical protein